MIRIILGVGLMIAAFAVLFIFLSGPDNKLLNDIMTSLTCNRGEHFVEVQGDYVYDSSDGSYGRNVQFFCQTETSKRDVSLSAVALGVGGFAIPFVVGLLLFITGIVGAARRRANTALVGFAPRSGGFQTDSLGQRTQFDDVQVSSQSPIQGGRVMMINGRKGKLSDLPPETAKMVEQVLGGMSGMMTMSDFDNQPDLTDKLQQLQEARDKGLITGEEYDRLRKEILDKLGK